MTGVGGSGGESLRTVVFVTVVVTFVVLCSESESEALEELDDESWVCLGASESVTLVLSESESESESLSESEDSEPDSGKGTF